MSKLIVDAETGIETIVEFSAKEKADFAKSEIETAAIVAEMQKQFVDKEAAKAAVLAKLGLTAEEIAVLFS
jgi:hypothetical protein